MKFKNISVLSLGVIFLVTSCVKDSGKVSYTYNKATAVYQDINAIRAEPLQGDLQAIQNPGKIFVGQNMILIGERNEGIHVFDNTNPGSPTNVAFINLPFTDEFYVKDNFIYAEGHYDFLKIDISNLTQPILVDREINAFGEPQLNDQGEVLIGFTYNVVTESFKLNTPEAEALKRTNYLYFDYMNNLIPESKVPSSFVGNDGDSKGTLNKIAVSNNHIYVIGDAELHVFSDDISNIQYLTSKAIGTNLETIYPEGSNLFVGTSNSMIILNASNPSSPDVTSTYSHPNSCDPVLPNGNVAYLTLRTADNDGCAGDINSLEVIDITNLGQPQVIQEIMMQSPYGMAIIGDKLFVGEGNNGVSIFDATNPNSLIFITRNTSVKGFDVLAHPTNTGIVLITGVNGLEEYQFNSSTNQLQKLSSINY